MANVPGGMIGPIYGGSPVLGGGSPIPAGQTNIPGGTGFTPGYGLGVPQQGAGVPPPTGPFYSGAGGGPIQGGGLFSVEQPMDPRLTGQLFSYLSSQVGKGVSPFNLPTQLPFGGTTRPGQLNAPANPLLMSLFNFYQGKGGGNIPGANTLQTIANQGISALPEWQQMVAAQGQNISQNEAQLKEQFAGMGGLASSEFGNAASNYMQGVTAQQNALLGQLQQQNILQGQIPVAEQLLSGGQQMGQYAQSVNQQAINSMLNEFIRTSPQYNPLLGLQYGAATTFNPVFNRAGMTSPSLLSSLLGPALGGIGAGATAAAGGASTLDAILAGLAAV